MKIKPNLILFHPNTRKGKKLILFKSLEEEEPTSSERGLGKAGETHPHPQNEAVTVCEGAGHENSLASELHVNPEISPPASAENPRVVDFLPSRRAGTRSWAWDSELPL